jgi:ribonuclease HI
MEQVDVYTDGGCHTCSGVGGWAVIVYEGSRPIEMSGHEAGTTNQRMELRAAIEGLKRLENPRRVRLFSDSAYLINGMNQQWYLKWEQNGWKNSKKKPVENPDLWKELVTLSRYHTVEWRKVKGHAGIGANERCDALVQREISMARRLS